MFGIIKKKKKEGGGQKEEKWRKIFEEVDRLPRKERLFIYEELLRLSSPQVYEEYQRMKRLLESPAVPMVHPQYHERYYKIQKRGVRKLFDKLLFEREEHLLLIGMTGSGKTTFVKALLGSPLADSYRATVLDWNAEYEWYSSLAYFNIRRDALRYFLKLMEPSLPQEMLLLLLRRGRVSVEELERMLQLQSSEYDYRIIRALLLRLRAFEELIGTEYTRPIAKLHSVDPDLRTATTAAILADRLLDEHERELIVVEEAQSLSPEALGFLAEEGRKKRKRLVFVTNNVERVPASVLHNSIVLVFQCLPIVKFHLGVLDQYFRPEGLKKFEFYYLAPGERYKLYKVKPW